MLLKSTEESSYSLPLRTKGKDFRKPVALFGQHFKKADIFFDPDVGFTMHL